MIEKTLFHTALGRLKRGGVRIQYWDGDIQTYGPDKPYATIHLKSPRVVRRMVRNTSLGFGESYSEGLIEVDGPLTSIVRLASQNQIALHSFLTSIGAARLKRNRRSHQKTYIAHHYDVGNDFYALWLDKSMLYTCAYYRTARDTLENAQSQKIEYVLRKLRLEKGHTLADLGCGWGTLLITAAKKYGVKGIGVTLSEEQVKHAQTEAKRQRVDHLVSFKLMNYQDLPAHQRGVQFDRVVSVGMMEHVGRGNQDTYFQTVDALLKPGGISLAHFISQQTPLPNDAWIDKYIFPGGYLPTPSDTMTSLAKHGFRLTDYENLRMHYAYTCREWRRRYNAHKDEIIAMFDEQFYRTWDFWLACSEATFEYGNIDLSHFVFTKGIFNDLPLTRHDWYR